jgi:hypothetical protein
MTMGNMLELENEAAKQLDMHPIPATILNLFCGRLINLPEHMLKGRLSSSGKCEYTITLHGMLMLLFIEFKSSLAGSHESHSNIVVRIVAEADGVDAYNQIREFDRLGIHVILTDGSIFEFYAVDFHEWKILRSVATVGKGILRIKDFDVIAC